MQLQILLVLMSSVFTGGRWGGEKYDGPTSTRRVPRYIHIYTCVLFVGYVGVYRSFTGLGAVQQDTKGTRWNHRGQ